MAPDEAAPTVPCRCKPSQVIFIHPNGQPIYDRFVKACPVGLMLGEDLRLNAAMAVAQDFYGQFTDIAFESFLTLAVSGVSSRVGNGVILGAAQVLGHFGLQGAFGELLSIREAPDPTDASGGGLQLFTASSRIRTVDDIAAQVRSRVADGRLRPGDRLPAERELAAKLKVSRTTLREALRTLEYAGVVEMREGATGGAFVRSGSSGVIVTGLSDLFHLGAISPQQLTEARIWLNELVVLAARERATPHDLAALEANVAEASLTHASGRFDERQRLHRDFHVILARATQNPIIAITMEGVMGVFGQFIEKIGPRENPYTLPSRKRFLRLLRLGETDAAVLEMTRHLKRLHRQYLALWTGEAAANGQPVAAPLTRRL